MAIKQKSLGGVNVELGTKAECLDLTRENTTASLYLSLEQVRRLSEILVKGEARLAKAADKPQAGKTPKLQINVKLGTKQKRIFAPQIAWRAK